MLTHSTTKTYLGKSRPAHFRTVLAAGFLHQYFLGLLDRGIVEIHRHGADRKRDRRIGIGIGIGIVVVLILVVDKVLQLARQESQDFVPAFLGVGPISSPLLSRLAGGLGSEGVHCCRNIQEPEVDGGMVAAIIVIVVTRLCALGGAEPPEVLPPVVAAVSQRLDNAVRFLQSIQQHRIGSVAGTRQVGFLQCQQGLLLFFLPQGLDQGVHEPVHGAGPRLEPVGEGRQDQSLVEPCGGRFGRRFRVGGFFGGGGFLGYGLGSSGRRRSD
mmetsp:Transcript_17624/g.48746  ORF Transcript_17624/g.48746 Transcript_17624/m.48746 type:complete len:270 (+) Transcript_17624:1753-2562(+)